MSKKSKREERIRVNPCHVSREDFEALAIEYGQLKYHGKHAKAYIGELVIIYKIENRIKPVYVELLLKAIDRHKGEEK